MLRIFSRAVGEAIHIGDEFEVEVIQIDGEQNVTLEITQKLANKASIKERVVLNANTPSQSAAQAVGVRQ